MADKQTGGAAAKTRLSPMRFFRESRAEFKKVVWPTRKQVINNTVVVLVAMLVTGLFIWGLDSILSQLIAWVLKTQ